MVWLPTPAWTTNGTKLLPPKQRAGLVARSGIEKDADAHLDRRLFLVTAPAGYGKTSTLIRLHEHLKTRQAHAAWLSLDRDDNDLVRFLAHLVDAIARTGLDLAARPEGLLGNRSSAQHGLGSTPSSSTLKAELLNELAQVGNDLFVFLDDFHLIREPAVLDLVGAVLLAPLEHVHLVIASREVPPLPLARLRALGGLHEIEASQLAFSLTETQDFIRANGGVELTPAQLSALVRKTEGWPASLQMALIAMRRSSDADGFLASFSGSDRSIADFLVEEVLKSVPDAVQRFLLGTSPLARFNAGLANAVLGREDAREMIDHLESHNLFLFSLDRDRNWYRYHHLFGELLRRRLRETQSPFLDQVHARACDWLAANGHAVEAIDHAFAAGNIERAGALVDAVSDALFASAQTATLAAFADRLPADVRKRLPRLQLEVAWEDIIRWRFDAARAALEDTRRQLAGGTLSSALPEAELGALRVKLAHRDVMMETFTDRLQEMQLSGRSWIAENGTRSGFMGLSIAVAMMMARRESMNAELVPSEWSSLRGQFVEARAIYGTVFLDAVVGQTLFLRGELGLAEEALRQGLATAIRLQEDGSSFAAMPGCLLAALLYERNTPDAALRVIEGFAQVPSAFGLTDSIIARMVCASRLAAGRGDLAVAHRLLDEGATVADLHGLSRLHARVAFERIRLLVSKGQPRDAQQVARDPRHQHGFSHTAPGRRPDSTKLHYALGAILLEGERDPPAAIALIRPWLVATRERRCVQHSITLLVMLAKLQARSGERLAAQRSLIEALRLGAGGGFRRSFLDGGTEIEAVVRDIRDSRPGPEVCSTHYLAKIFTDFRLDSTPPPAIRAPRPLAPDDTANLSDKEIEVLRLSANHLVAREVAQQLGVAETTVKWYWRRIFSKLGVHRRAAAVRIAQERGLIR